MAGRECYQAASQQSLNQLPAFMGKRKGRNKELKDQYVKERTGVG